MCVNDFGDPEVHQSYTYSGTTSSGKLGSSVNKYTEVSNSVAGSEHLDVWREIDSWSGTIHKKKIPFFSCHIFGKVRFL